MPDADLCVIFNYIPGPGGGPRLHTHPYAETFIVRAGTGLFTLGDQQVTATEGQILIAPANTPHLHFAVFELGPDRRWWKGRPIDPYLVLRQATRP